MRGAIKGEVCLGILSSRVITDMLSNIYNMTGEENRNPRVSQLLAKEGYF